MEQQDIVLRLRRISKRFGATQALDSVDFAVRSGEVLALMGENGAGKSTLLKILSGALQPDEGVIELKGQPCAIGSPLSGGRLGIAMIYQEMNLIPDLNAEENIILGREKHTLGIIRHESRKIQRVFQLLQHPEFPLDVPVGTLGIGQQQLVEIARALFANARIILMDEPTSSLSTNDARALFEVIRQLKRQGIAVIYVSHFLDEVAQIADSYTVLRDGKTVASGAMADTTIPAIVRLMVGRDVPEMFPRIEHTHGEILLRVESLEGMPLPRGVSLELHRGEILGIAGLVGAGRTEILRRIFGLDRAVGGTLRTHLGGAALCDMTPRRAMSLGINLLSENRREEGLILGLSIVENTTLPCLSRFALFSGWGPLSRRRESSRVRYWIDHLRIRCRDERQSAGELSGGNQQKVALGRILEQNSDILLFDEPTRGIDVATKVEIYRLLGHLAEAGKGVVFVSSYLPELLGVCDTLVVMHRGRLSRSRPVCQWTPEEIMLAATSGEGIVLHAS